MPTEHQHGEMKSDESSSEDINEMENMDQNNQHKNH